MPLYEYHCDDCDTRFERLVKAWGEAVACPSCEGASVTKLLSTFAMSTSNGSSSSGGPAPMAGGGGGACCGGGCGCN